MQRSLNLLLIPATVLLGVALAAAQTSPPVAPPQWYVRPPQPAYPFAQRLEGIEGVVLVRVVIGRDGKAKGVWIAQSSGNEALDKEALTAVARAEWIQMPQEVHAVVPIRFVLQ